MCGRFTIRKPVTKTVDIVKTNIKVEDSDNYNAHPTQKLPIIKSYTNGKALELCEWGLVPNWSKKLDKIIVATSQNQQDDEIADYCNENSILCFRGDETNVLRRYYEAAKKFNAYTIVRLTADCPLIDFNIIDTAIGLFEKNK